MKYSSYFSPQAQIARFWERVQVGDPNDCWPWTGCINSNGYGAVRFCGEVYQSHRLAWFLTHGSLPELPLMVLHKCDKPLCCNFRSHLFTGSGLENSLDMSAKVRAPLTNATLTAETAKQAIDLIRAGKFKNYEIAQMFGISKQNISNLIAGRCWPQVTGIRPSKPTPSVSVSRRGGIRRYTSAEKTQR